MKKLLIFRCEECASVLKDSGCYICENGTKILLKKIELITVPKVNCECCSQISNKRMKSIKIDKTEKYPWKVVFWDEEWEGEQGISSFFGSYSSFGEAYREAIKGSRVNDWASCEVRLKIGEDIYSIFCYATTEPYANEFIAN